ncbi:MAG TPA: glucose-1-phosphate adenylyltransferase [Streptosporangiaceae bacterium]|nr:glucose-1-phosphate adenylyltransferase [Streptosporangiaceae bacterium]
MRADSRAFGPSGAPDRLAYGGLVAGQRVLGIVLAGGAGRRLVPLTADRAKSAITFGGFYRLVDFALSNLVNGDIQRICVLTQYKSHSLNRHIITAWQLNGMLGSYVMPVPAQQRLGPYWQVGSADAIYQSLNLIHADRPDIVVVVGADHVYRMDPRQMIEAHLAWGAGVTVAAIPVPREQASGFGVVQVAPGEHRIEVFAEKPAYPPGRPGQPDESWASMGIYVFSTDVLVDALSKDAAEDGSRHSVGGDIMPMLTRGRAAHMYDFGQNKVPGTDERDPLYWRDLGTLDAYFEAHMDLCAVHPAFSLHNDRWPILTGGLPQPPAKFVYEQGDWVGQVINSLISNGVIVYDGLVRNSILSPGVRVSSCAQLNHAVILHNSRVGRHAVVENAILDKRVVVADGATVGVDKEHDKARGFAVSSGGITVVGKGQHVAPLRPGPWWTTLLRDLGPYPRARGLPRVDLGVRPCPS